jgi:hypothetical protein
LRTEVGVLLVLTASAAQAQPGEQAIQLNREGVQLARMGRQAEAIERFKLADLRVQKSQHHCNIGRAYLELDKLPQAYLFLESCKTRAGKKAEPWLPGLMDSTLKQMNDERFGRVQFKLPLGYVRVVDHPADEEWLVDAKRELLLPVGPRGVDVRLADGRRWQQQFVVEGGLTTDVLLMPPLPVEPAATPQTTGDAPAVALAPRDQAPVPEPVSVAAQPVASGAPPDRTVAFVVGGSGAAVVALGFVPWGLANAARSSAVDPQRADDAARRQLFEVTRLASFSTFSVGAGLLTSSALQLVAPRRGWWGSLLAGLGSSLVTWSTLGLTSFEGPDWRTTTSWVLGATGLVSLVLGVVMHFANWPGG